MTGLSDATRDARAHADVCIDPSCHRVALALEGALDAEFHAIKDAEHEPADLTGIPDPAVKSVWITRPEREN